MVIVSVENILSDILSPAAGAQISLKAKCARARARACASDRRRALPATRAADQSLRATVSEIFTGMTLDLTFFFDSIKVVLKLSHNFDYPTGRTHNTGRVV